MANLDPKTTQTISKFSPEDVAVIVEKKLYAIVDSDKEIQSIKEKLAALESNQGYVSEPKDVLENNLQTEQQKISDTLYVLTTIGSFSVEFNSIVLKGLYTTYKNETTLSSDGQESLKSTIAALVKAREELQGETYDFDATTEDAEVESKVEEEVEEVAAPVTNDELEALKEENEKLKTKTISLQTRIRELEDKAKLFMYCGLGVACITLLSLVFSIIGMAK